MPKIVSVNDLIEAFVSRLTDVVHQEAEVRARVAVMGAFGQGPLVKPRKKPSPHRQLAGRYMGLFRTMKKRDHKQIKGVRVAKGVEAAIKLMTEMAAARA